MDLKFLKNLFFTFIFSLLLVSLYNFNVRTLVRSSSLYQSPFKYSQPLVIKSGSFSIKSIDTQVVTKNWKNVSPAQVDAQVKLLKDLNVNYIAIAVPYDDPKTFKLWADTIHKYGLKVWYRSHWNNWEGDNGFIKNMPASNYLIKTQNFIRDNRTIFKDGDAFTACVEPEQAGVGVGKTFENWDAYRQFVKDQVGMANITFDQIGLINKINTNWVSVNGWVALNQFDQETANYLGFITVDEHSTSTQNSVDYAKNIIKELDGIYNKWKKPIFVGEWGYSIDKEVTQERQAEFIKEVYKTFDGRDYIFGMNYWIHMGHHSRIIDDVYGKNLTLRTGALVIKDFYSR